jgi:hypothetical protein
MGRRWLANLVLLLVLALLSLGVRHELAREGRPQTLAGVDPKDLRLIEVDRDGEPRIRIERGPDGWRLLEPLEVDADQARLERLLEILGSPVQRSFPEQSAALGELGLAPSKLRLRLDGLTLAFGGLDPLSQQRYVAADGLVHLIEDRFYHLLIAPPIDFVSRSLLPVGRAPAFATLGGVPLAAGSLGVLAGLTAERVEPLAGEFAGVPVQVKFADGRALRFLVSEDRRRWSRLDQKLRYVLTDGPLLELDPEATDPTPPEPPPTTVADQEPGAATTMQTQTLRPEEQIGMDEVDLEPGLPADEPDLDDPFAPIADPDAPAFEGMKPPEVRLRPEGPGDDDGYLDEGKDAAGGFGAEPYKDPPQGFGMDPFAPDPSYDAESKGEDR